MARALNIPAPGHSEVPALAPFPGLPASVRRLSRRGLGTLQPLFSYGRCTLCSCCSSAVTLLRAVAVFSFCRCGRYAHAPGTTFTSGHCLIPGTAAEPHAVLPRGQGSGPAPRPGPGRSPQHGPRSCRILRTPYAAAGAPAFTAHRHPGFSDIRMHLLLPKVPAAEYFKFYKAVLYYC